MLRWKGLCRGAAHSQLGASHSHGSLDAGIHPDGPAVTPEPQHCAFGSCSGESASTFYLDSENSLPFVSS